MSKISTQDRTMIETWHKTRLDGNQRFTGKTDSDLSLKDRTEKAKWIDNNVNMALHGYSILGKVRAEFSDNDFSRKFEMDFRQAKSINPDKSLGYFIEEETERINAIKWAIETCLDNYREHPEHVTLDNYLTFLKAESKPTTTTGTEPPVFTGSKLIDVYDPQKVHAEFKKELRCDYDTFKAWFIDGVICSKQMDWKYKNGNKTQLRSFLYVLTGGWEPAQTKTAFKIDVDSSTRQTAINEHLLQRIEKCTAK